MGKLPVRLPSYVALKEHVDAEATFKGTTYVDAYAPYYLIIASGGTIASASVTLSKKCLVVVVAFAFFKQSAQVTQIRRDGVDKTKETVISGADAYSYRVHVQYATEVLDAGSYTYSLVNSSGSSLFVHGAALKIVAVECG